MKKLTLLLLAVVFASACLAAGSPSEKKDFLGEWKFESQHSPEGYHTGVFVIEEKEGQLAGEIRFADGNNVKMDNITVEEGVLKFSIQVDYNPVNIKATIEDNVMKGAAASPEGDIPFEAKKVKKETP